MKSNNHISKALSEIDNLVRLFDSIPSPNVLWRSKDLIYERVTPSYQALFPRKVLIGKPFLEAVPEPEYLPFFDIIRGVFDTGNAVTLKEQLVWFDIDGKGMKDRYYTLSFFQIKDADGRPYGVYQHAEDNTEQVFARKRIEESERQVRESQEKLQLALERGQMGIWQIDLETNKVVLTPEAMALFLIDTHEINLPELINSMMYPEDIEEIKKVLSDAISEKKPYLHEYRIIRTDGQVRWLRARGDVVLDLNGDAKYYSGTVQDITEQVEARKQAEVLTLELREALLAKDEERKKLEESLNLLKQERKLRERFVAALSHDLRTPLAAAKMSSELIARKLMDDPAMFKAANRITDNMNRADGMIRDILDASLIKAGEKVQLRIQLCQMKVILSEVIEDFEGLHGDKFQIKMEEEIEGYWDFEAMKRILENLLSNAIKYGEIGTKVTVSAKTAAKNVLLSVHNYGFPISESELSSLFDQYKRSQTAQQSGQKGWGLGLTLVKGITESHGGKVSVSSDSVSGTTFTVEIPKDSR